ncbi:serine/threonineprotein kinase [Pelomyxa schiedti]|nr:serine/threonineprotein kinase [Pelomyxa schiedti]
MSQSQQQSPQQQLLQQPGGNTATVLPAVGGDVPATDAQQQQQPTTPGTTRDKIHHWARASQKPGPAAAVAAHAHSKLALAKKQRSFKISYDTKGKPNVPAASTLFSVRTVSPESFVRNVKMFGIPLQSLKKEQFSLGGVPLIVEHCIALLHAFFIDGVLHGSVIRGVEHKIGPRNLRQWTVAQVGQWIEAIGFPEYSASFVANQIKGSKLLLSSEEELVPLIPNAAHHKLILTKIGELDLSLKQGENVIRGDRLCEKDLYQLMTLQDAYDNGRPVDLFSIQLSPTVISMLLKLYLRSLPDPLISHESASHLGSLMLTKTSFQDVSVRSEDSNLVANLNQEINSVINSLPKLNQVLLHKLLDFLQLIATHPASLCLEAMNTIAGSFSSCIFHSRETSEDTLHQALLKAMIANHLPSPRMPVDRPLATPRELLPCEAIFSTIEKVSLHIGSICSSPQSKSDWISGTVYITNFRVIWKSDQQKEKHLAGTDFSDITFTSLCRIHAPRVDPPIVRLFGKQFHAIVLSFPSASEQTRFFEDISSVASGVFALNNRELHAIPFHRRKEVGWGIFSVNMEYARMNVTRDFQISEVEDKGALPKKCICPVAFNTSPGKLAYVKERVPLLSWFNPRTKKFVLRSIVLKNGSTVEPQTRATAPAYIRRNTLACVSLKTELDSTTSFIASHSVRLVQIIDDKKSSERGIVGVPIFVESVQSMEKVFGQLQNLFFNFSPLVEWEKHWLTLQSAWLKNIHSFVEGSVVVSSMIAQNQESAYIRAADEEEESVNILTSLVCILLDPFYRTFRGFAVLVEKEWFAYDYAFHNRGPLAEQEIPIFESLEGFSGGGSTERMPVSFLQFIDCVWQLWSGMPYAFEFSDHFLLFVVHQCVLHRFGTFMCNGPDDPDFPRISSESPSLWAFVSSNIPLWKNPLYSPQDRCIAPEFKDHVCHFWTQFFLNWKNWTHVTQYLDAVNSHTSSLKITNLQLTSFPCFPAPTPSLIHLSEINMSGNLLTTIPSCLFQLKSLVTIELADNQIEAIAPAVVITMGNRLLQLKHFGIASNHLCALPANISYLKTVSSLDLSHNEFSSSLRPLYTMSSLRMLNLSSSLLKRKLPSGFSQLVSLEELYVSDNMLESIPDVLPKSWISLKTLDLSRNKLKFPTCLTCMSKLQTLNLSGNIIDFLPLKISLMEGITDLDLSNNQIVEVTPALGMLASLQRLSLEKNKYTSLPPTLGLLNRLQKFTHVETILTDCRTISDKLTLFREELKSLVQNTHGKIFLVGRENVGKTVLFQCLVKKFKKHTENMRTISTDGIQIYDWEFTAPTSPQKIRVSIWDFAGQIIHTSTHQFFLSDRAIYILVWKIPMGESACRVHYWLNNITTSAKNAVVFIVGTHVDEMTPPLVEKAISDLEQKYSKLFPNLTLKFRPVSNLTKDGLKRLRSDIQKAVVCMPQMSLRVPSTFLLLEQQLKFWKSCVPPVIHRKDWQFAAKCCFISDEDTLSAATQYLHNLGSLIAFQQHPLLRELVIVDPTWLPKVMATVITEKHKWHKDGILKVSNLDQIWRPPDFPPHLHPIVVKLLEFFHIIFVISEANFSNLSDFLTSVNKSPALSKSQIPAPVVKAPIEIPSNAPASPVNTPVITSPLSSPNGVLTPPPLILASEKSTPPLVEESDKPTVALDEPSPIVESAPPLAADALILIPSLLPADSPSNLDQVWPSYHSGNEVEIGRRYKFQYIPDGLVSRFMVSLAHYYKFQALWKDGFIIEIQKEKCPVIKSLIRQNVEQNTLNVQLRFISKGGSEEFNSVGYVLQLLLETLGGHIRDWFKVNVATSVLCSKCLKHGSPNPFTFDYELCERAVMEGTNEIVCGLENDSIPLMSLVPDLVIGNLRQIHGSLIVTRDNIEFLEQVGEGAAATVFKGKLRGEIVAAKIFKIEREGLGALSGNPPAYDLSCKVAECRREIQVMSRCVHPNIVCLKGLLLEPLCLVTSFLNGGTLYSYIQNKSKPLPYPLAVLLATDTAKAVDILHSCEPPIIHRDLKSPNVLLRLDDRPQAVLCDFGLSSPFEVSSKVNVENPIWLAPEALRGEPITTACDIYALGVIFWELCTRNAYFGEIRFMSELTQVVISGRRPPIPATIPPTFSHLIEQCWAQDPSERPGTRYILSVLDDCIRSINDDDDDEVPPPPPPLEEAEGS